MKYCLQYYKDTYFDEICIQTIKQTHIDINIDKFQEFMKCHKNQTIKLNLFTISWYFDKLKKEINPIWNKCGKVRDEAFIVSPKIIPYVR